MPRIDLNDETVLRSDEDETVDLMAFCRTLGLDVSIKTRDHCFWKSRRKLRYYATVSDHYGRYNIHTRLNDSIHGSFLGDGFTQAAAIRALMKELSGKTLEFEHIQDGTRFCIDVPKLSFGANSLRRYGM